MTKIHETKKAVLLEKDGAKFWVQKRWLKADGSLTPAGQKSFDAAKAAAEEAAKGQKYYKILHLIKKETDKAVMIEVNVDLYNVEKDVTRSIWIPKSLIINGYAAWWFIAKKIEEVQDEIYERYNTGGVVDTDFDEFIYVKKEN